MSSVIVLDFDEDIFITFPELKKLKALQKKSKDELIEIIIQMRKEIRNYKKQLKINDAI